MSEIVNPAFHASTNARLDRLIEDFDATPAARYLARSTTIDARLFGRYTIETSLRIRLARIADSKVIQHFARTNPFAAQKWSKYTEERMLHDRLFLKDLKYLGVGEDTVSRTDPLLATKLLQGYLYYTIEHEGPRGLLSTAYFVEYTIKKTQALWIGNVKRALGGEAVQGAEAYLDYHLDADHATEIWNVLMSVVKTPDEEARVLYHLEVYYGLLVAYFNELASTAQIDVSRSPLDPAGTAVWGAQRAGTRRDDE